MAVVDFSLRFMTSLVMSIWLGSQDQEGFLLTEQILGPVGEVSFIYCTIIDSFVGPITVVAYRHSIYVGLPVSFSLRQLAKRLVAL